MNYAQVILFKKPGEFDQALTYKIPDHLKMECQVGIFVKVPLRQQLVRGVVIDLIDRLPKEGIEIKDVGQIISNFSLPESLINLAKKMSVYYLCSMTRILKMMLPKKVWNGSFKLPAEKQWHLLNQNEVLRGERQKQVCDLLKSSGPCMESVLRKNIGVSLATLKNLEKKGIVQSLSYPIFSKVDVSIFPLKPLIYSLTDSQQTAFDQMKKAKKPVVLHGVTGSGKTELYLRLILKIITEGKQAILMVPEIGLTPQMVDYFKGYFGEHMAVFHSKLSDGERALEWYKAYCGYAPLVIGSRSAVFAPFDKLGCVILDEEHEWTYKQESTPYYQTHTVANLRQEVEGGYLVLGSATPRLETLHQSRQGLYDYLYLPERVNQNPLPSIQIVDLRDEFKQKHFSIFSRSLIQKMEEALKKKEQMILFVNRRGQASAVVCRDCGYTELCPYCEVSLKSHRLGDDKEMLLCHYCNYRQPPSPKCPACGSIYIRHVGLGTQRVEGEIQKLFPGIRVLRADQDTTRFKGGFESMYRSFKKGEADVLIGTQMIAKGLDFENVSLIGIVLADIGLHMPDFRSHERLFQLITQVAGRCGRGESEGQVVLQTYQPTHFAIEKAAAYDYLTFAERELEFREKLNYPPFHSLIKFVVVGMDLNHLREHVKAEKEVLEDIFSTHKLPAKVIFAPAMIPKMGGRYYYHVLVRSQNPHIIFERWKVPKGWRIDVDPIHTA